ncbi:PdxT/SNO family [Xylariales sp. PMI_506]|nr:PdxT/SNO family [Xylariales sp. PMI_506]
MSLTVGVLALQGGFAEHLTSLRRSAQELPQSLNFTFTEVRTPEQLSACDALVIPGGESTTLSLVAVQSGLLEPLRDFVKVKRKPTWGTCAGLIFLSEAASAVKRGGQELVGGLDVRVHRNHFGRQKESFVTGLHLAFLAQPGSADKPAPFPAVFIRAPVVDKLLTDDINNKSAQDLGSEGAVTSNGGAGDIVALQQGNVFGTSFHPELTDDIRIHTWWLKQVVESAASNGKR